MYPNLKYPKRLPCFQVNLLASQHLRKAGRKRRLAGILLCFGEHTLVCHVILRDLLDFDVFFPIDAHCEIMLLPELPNDFDLQIIAPFLKQSSNIGIVALIVLSFFVCDA